MSHRSDRGYFGSKIGLVLATAGSAVGLGNIWRFPYMAGHNGGAAFILIYLGCVFMLGVPGMISEFIVGRHSAANASRAYSIIGSSRKWRFVGLLGILTSVIILGFYSVVAGWCLQYLYASIVGHLNGDADYVMQYFRSFSSDPLKPCFWAVMFVLVTHFVVIKGIRNGIERASKILMPLLLLLLVVIVVASCMLPDAWNGVVFLLKPDFSCVDGNVALEALGQAFFSLSLGTACLCTYGSYFKREVNLANSAVQIALMDSAIAILAGLMIFPAAFSVGVNPDSGPSLIFITLPIVFTKAFGAVPFVGWVISVMFYSLLVFAALTSTISMHEIGTAFFHEELRQPRYKAGWIVTLVASVVGIFCALSVGAIPDIQVLGMTLLDFCDVLTALVMLPIGALLTCVLIGWVVPDKTVRNEFTNNGELSGRMYNLYFFCVKYFCPILILLILLHKFGVI